MNNLHFWQYFIALEEDFKNTTRYVELSEENMDTYSIEFARLLLSICSEIEVVARKLTNQKNVNMDKLAPILNDMFGGQISQLKVMIPTYHRISTPWEDIRKGETPTWWKAYNQIKHKRHLHFSNSSLKNVLGAISGLFVLNCYLYKAELESEDIAELPSPWPQLLTLEERLANSAKGTIHFDLRRRWHIPATKSLNDILDIPD